MALPMQSVGSLKALRALVKRSGYVAQEVTVSRTLKRLCDAKSMAKLLLQKRGEDGWIVHGVHKLEFLVPICRLVHKALEATNKLVKLVDPDANLDELNVATAAQLKTRVREEARKLRKTGRRLKNVSGYTPAVHLGEHLIEVGKSIRKKPPPADLPFSLHRLREHGRDSYNQAVDMDSVDA